MLTSYQQTTRLLLNDVTFARFNDFDLRRFINLARSQIAGEGEAIRVLGSLPTVAGQQSYHFSDVPLTAPEGISGALTVRMIGLGGKILSPRSWEWLFEYYIAPNISNGSPVDWAQLGQGTSGTFFLGPPPDAVATMLLDIVAVPLDLMFDSDPEALPWPFRDAVPYYATYMALLSVQQFDAAERHYELYERFVKRARAISTPTVLPGQYPGSTGAQLASQNTPITPSTAAAPAGRGSRDGG